MGSGCGLSTFINWSLTFNTSACAKDRGLSGMLIYPDVGRSLRLRYRLLGIPVLVATVDLGQEWHDIEAELHGLLDDCASAASLPWEHAATTDGTSRYNTA